MKDFGAAKQDQRNSLLYRTVIKSANCSLARRSNDGGVNGDYSDNSQYGIHGEPNDLSRCGFHDDPARTSSWPDPMLPDQLNIATKFLFPS